jgi:DNA polymerase-3 subunit delta
MLTGEEPFFIDQITDLLIANVINENERDFDQLILYGRETTAIAVIEAARRFPMMSGRQLIIVREAQEMKDIEALTNYVNRPLSSTILVINYKYKTLDKRKSLAKAIDKIGILFESELIKDYKMPAFITSFLRQRSIHIDMKGSQMLADYLGNDLSRLNKELEKLLLLLPEKGAKEITPELIEQNIGISKEYNNFELINAVAAKDILKVNRIIRHFEKNPKENPLRNILPVLFNYFSNLLIIYYSKDKSERGIMNELGFRQPIQARDYLFGLKNFPAMKVFNLISEIRTADAQSKGVENASLTEADILKELVYKILH